MANMICQLCLRTDIHPKPIGFLASFLQELCENEIKQSPCYKICSCCAHLLKKFYNFKQQCLKACRILNSMSMDNKLYPSDLHEQIPMLLGHNKHNPLIYSYNENENHIQDSKQNFATEPANKIYVRNLSTEKERDNFFNVKIEQNIEEDDSGSDKIEVDIKIPNNDDVKCFDARNAQNIKVEPYDPLQESLNSGEDSDDNDDDDKNIDTDDESSDEEENNLLKAIKEGTIRPIIAKELTLEVAELLLKVNNTNKLLRARVKYLKLKADLKKMILRLFDEDNYDMGDGTLLKKDVFLKIFQRCEKPFNYLNDIFVNEYNLDQDKIRILLRYLLKLFNPEYETVFDIEYLDTEEKKIQEFNRRKTSEKYLSSAFKCELCYKGFHLESLYLNHRKRHVVGPGERRCHLCSLKVARKGENCHTAVYSCKLCPLVTYYADSMMNHFAQHKGVKHQCTICFSEFKNKQTLLSHARVHARHACAHCAGAYVSAVGLTMHVSRKHKDVVVDPNDMVLCAQCNITFVSQAVLRRHLKQAHRDRDYRCHCKEVFTSMAELRTHKTLTGHSRLEGTIRPKDTRKLTTVNGVVVDSCPICNEAVPIRNGLAMYRHYARVHPTDHYQKRKSSHLCHVCGKGFTHPQALLDHHNVHTGAKPYKCVECPASFATSISLYIHGARHRPAKHTCNYCGKMFKSNSNLNNHRRIHIGDRRFKCHICGKGFLYSASLTEHVNGVHYNIRKVKKGRGK